MRQRTFVPGNRIRGPFSFSVLALCAVALSCPGWKFFTSEEIREEERRASAPHVINASEYRTGKRLVALRALFLIAFFLLRKNRHALPATTRSGVTHSQTSAAIRRPPASSLQQPLLRQGSRRIAVSRQSQATASDRPRRASLHPTQEHR